MTDKAKADKGQKRPEKAKNELSALKVLVAGKVGDGKGGYFAKGDTFEPGVGCDAQGLKDRGLAE